MTRTERIADVIVQHSFDHEAGECMCGWVGDRRALAEHVAERVEAIL